MMKLLAPDIESLLTSGTAIPAHPLVLDGEKAIDEFRQRRLTRYYLHCGVGGLAVGVHTTQFEIRDPRFNLYERVLRLTIDELSQASLDRPFIKVAGVCGETGQAVHEAGIAAGLGYDLALLSLGGLNAWTDDQLIAHVEAVAQVMPVFGFYLQPAVGGRVLSYQFWRRFVQIPNVRAIKVAAFNRYQTLDVMRAVCESGRSEEIAMYTGNDDNIVADLLTTYRFGIADGRVVEKSFVGGLLGHFSVWTSAAVRLIEEVKRGKLSGLPDRAELLAKGVAVTDMNAAIFDPQHAFKGSIAGIHEVLRRQGLIEYIHCLNPSEILSTGQSAEIDRVCCQYPDLIDDQFVLDFLAQDLMANSRR